MSEEGAATQDEGRRGTVYAFAAYGLWGLFPLYFHALLPAGAWEVLSHRVLWTLAFCVLLLLVRRDLAWIPRLVRNRRVALGVTAAALLIGVNWTVYVAAVQAGLTHEAALGYFINPLVTVALGVVVLRERLRPLQWLALGIGGVAAVYLAVASDGFPWIALALALSFGGYGLVKKKVGATLSAVHSLSAETAVLAPVALVTLGLLTAHHETTYVGHGAWHTAGLTVAGVVTAIPLLLFAAAARRVPLVTIGLIQFLTPVVQLLLGVLVLGEHLTRERWIGFAIVWAALAVLSIDSLHTFAQRPRTRSR